MFNNTCLCTGFALRPVSQEYLPYAVLFMPDKHGTYIILSARDGRVAKTSPPADGDFPAAKTNISDEKKVSRKG